MPEAGWEITFQKDITANILPTLSYAHMWASRFGMPFFELAALRLRRKQPGLHHLFSNVLEELRGVGADNRGGWIRTGLRKSQIRGGGGGAKLNAARGLQTGEHGTASGALVLANVKSAEGSRP